MADEDSITIDLQGRIEVQGELSIAICDKLPLIGTGNTAEDAVRSFLLCFNEYIRLSQEWGAKEEPTISWSPKTSASPGRFALSLPRMIGSQGVPILA
jgi:hypothetical protein